MKDKVIRTSKMTFKEWLDKESGSTDQFGIPITNRDMLFECIIAIAMCVVVGVFLVVMTSSRCCCS